MGGDSANGSYRVLAIDGGGIRGYYTAALVSGLARHFAGLGGDGAAADDPGAAFDLVCGTSAGAILACALAAGVPVERVRTLYRDEGARIFPRPSPIDWRNLWWCMRHWRRPGADATALRAALESTLGTETLGALHRRRGTALCLTTTDPERQSLRVLRTPHRDGGDAETSLVDACLASSAAPILFAPVRLRRLAQAVGEEEVLCDGGVVANNPVMIALLEALQVAGGDREIRVLSVGSGAFAGRPERSALGSRSIGYWINGLRLVHLSLEAQSRAAADCARALAPLLARPTRVVRLPDPPGSADDAALLRIDNASPPVFEALDRLAQEAVAMAIAGAASGEGDLSLLPGFFDARA